MSDPGRELAAAVGILQDYGDYGQLARRVTYLLAADGTILRVWVVDDVDTHADEVLASLADLVRE